MDKSVTEAQTTAPEKKEATTAAPENPVPATAAVQENPEEKPLVEVVAKKEKRRTVGNKIYDFGVFGSVAWAGVALLSAVSAHEALHGNNKMFDWLRSLNNAVTGGVEKGLTKVLPKSVSSDTIKGYARGTAMFATLGMGGNALMAPIKWLEDNRQKNAAHIDKLLGTTPPDPETIAHEPKQTWKSVFSGRLASWGLSYVAFLAMGPHVTDKISKGFGEVATKGWMKLRPKSNPENVRRWADIAAFDALFTLITAGLTYLFSRAVAKKNDKGALEDEIFKINTSAPKAFSTAFAHNPEVGEETEKEFSKTVKPARKLSAEQPALFTEKVAVENGLSHARS